MNFDLSDDQRMFGEAIDRLFDAQAAMPARDSAAEWKAYRELGLLALPFPTRLDGLDAGHETVLLLMEAYGRTLAEAPYLQSVLLAGRILAGAGDDIAREAISRITAGELRVAVCPFEPGHRYRWDTPSSRAVRTSSGWCLRGRKIAVLDGDSADMLICPADTPDGLGLLLVPADAPGVSLEMRDTPDGRRAADIVFTDVKLRREAAIGSSSTNPALLAAAIDMAMTACCAEAVGAMQQLLTITTDYLNARTQFGAPIGSFQALQHRAADMLAAIEQARSMMFYAISMLDAPAAERSAAVAAAKALINRAARFVGCEAIQLHGGMGLASEYPAGRYFQRLTVLETLFGDTDHLLARVEQGGGVLR